MPRTRAKKRKRCSFWAEPRSAPDGEGRSARTSSTEDGSTRPLAERLEPFSTQDEVAVLGTLGERRGTNEVEAR